MADGFDEPFADREGDDLARALIALNVVALASLRRRLPHARDRQAIRNALDEVDQDLAENFPSERIQQTTLSIGSQLNRRLAHSFFGTMATSTGLRIIGTDDPRDEATFGARTGRQETAFARVNLNPGLFVEEFARATTGRITTLRDGVVDGVRDALVREVVLGQGDPEALTQTLLQQWEREGVPSRIPTRRLTAAGFPVELNAEAHAAFIARDQIGSLQSVLTRERQMAAGIERFVWVSRRDSKVRDSHAARDGRSYTWADGAAGGEFPGGPPNCRCHARAMLPSRSTMRESLITRTR